MRRSAIAGAAKVVLSLGVLGAILAHVGVEEVIVVIGGMSKGFLGLAVALILAKTMVRALNWFQLIRASAPDVRMRSVAYAYFVGGFFGSLLPSTLGTDVARSTVIGMRGRESIETYLASTVLLNLLSLMVISAAALISAVFLFARPDPPAGIIAFSAAAALACLLGMLLLWIMASRHVHLPLAVAARPTSTFLSSVKKRIVRFITALTVLPRGRRLAQTVIVAALGYSMRSLGWLALLAAADVRISWAVLLTIGPLVQLGALLPVSVLGFGGHQAISVFLLAQWGVPAEHALAVSLLQSTIAVLLNASGCAVYLAGGKLFLTSKCAGDRADEKFPV